MHISAGIDQDMITARCESCGACVAYCPTGALTYKPSVEALPADKKILTTCPYCGVGCQFDLNVFDDQVVRVTSNPQAPVNCTNNIDHCARLCHTSTVAGLAIALGSGAMTNQMKDVYENANSIFVIGSNTTE